ncbi:uncharacterized protein LOC113938963 isoform X2 [Zalophus californianus]|uniref:Uncharacterized protein LOC113938963 isoform X2 n=1 Tax=Zalophus californianus TaxID=9704 RepID=A0A6P9EZR0_ZALCA|nr:uncharacterized protein LOC113938963 isoform X2 [Zalophus californianus]
MAAVEGAAAEREAGVAWRSPWNARPHEGRDLVLFTTASQGREQCLDAIGSRCSSRAPELLARRLCRRFSWMPHRFQWPMGFFGRCPHHSNLCLHLHVAVVPLHLCVTTSSFL